MPCPWYLVVYWRIALTYRVVCLDGGGVMQADAEETPVSKPAPPIATPPQPQATVPPPPQPTAEGTVPTSLLLSHTDGKKGNYGGGKSGSSRRWLFPHVLASFAACFLYLFLYADACFVYLCVQWPLFPPPLWLLPQSPRRRVLRRAARRGRRRKGTRSMRRSMRRGSRPMAPHSPRQGTQTGM